MNVVGTVLEGLNASQREAVKLKEGAALVVAGAGSGKTRIITSRIAYMVENGISPYEILAVTFTNKAAREMKNRVKRLVQEAVTIGTFHSVSMMILRQHAELVDRTNDFTIYDGDDQLVVIKECMKELSIDVKAISPKGIRERISRCKDDLTRPCDIKESVEDHEDRYFVPVFKLYEDRLRKANAFDFGDLIAKTVVLFTKNAQVLEHYRERFRYILVDEFQDTNHAQYMMIHLLASKYENIMVVGDPDQSIYEWRGANIENILKFEKVFKDVKIIHLEQNYRSTNNILKAANAIIANNSQRKDKNLWSKNGDGELIELVKLEDEKEEARYLVSEMLKLRRAGLSLNDIVGFYRTHAQSRVLEEELIRNNIPYRIVGGVKFYARKEVKDLLAYLRVVYNQNDEVSLIRVINLPKRAIGKGAIEKLRLHGKSRGMGLYDACVHYVHQGLAKGKLKAGLQQFVGLIEKFKTMSQGSLPLLLESIIEETGYVKMLENEATLEAKVRIENIKEFYGSIMDFEKTVDESQKMNTLQLYLEYISLQTDMDAWNVEGDIFTLMTLHSAKGLEYPVVFMLGMEEGCLPHINSINGSYKELEEERRLCYVGFTRAMKKLHLSFVVNRKQFGFSKLQLPSRFLREVPEFLLSNPLDQFKPKAKNRSYDGFDDFGADEDYDFY
ncbi:MAG: DNA helicase-2/ATP-dependent DNA helicase PcrA [Candidatus Omnitrophota bacterium]|jgi:DNA helicase-2/ATP-dependent DNA helicase PcrA